MMANVLHPYIDFPHRPVAHAPSPFGFGFGLGPSPSTSMMASTGWAASPGHTNPSSFHQLASSMTQSASSRPQKRGRSSEEREESDRYPSSQRDESMDGSPIPETPKIPAAKRVRATNPNPPSSKDGASGKQGTIHDNNDGSDDVDMGLLLASLPTDTLLPILLQLLQKQPSLKDTILPLIPRPSVEKAIAVLKGFSEKLAQAVPSGSSSTYILGRIRNPANDYVSTCISYFSHFSCMPSAPQASTSTPGTSQNTAPTYLSGAPPLEAFTFLTAITEQILAQHVVCQEEILKMLGPRLKSEWEAWRSRKQHDFQMGKLYGFESISAALRSLAASTAVARPEFGTARYGLANMMEKLRDWINQGGGFVANHQGMEQ